MVDVEVALGVVEQGELVNFLKHQRVGIVHQLFQFAFLLIAFIEDDVGHSDHGVAQLEVFLVLGIVFRNLVFADYGVELLADELAFVGIDDE